MQKNKRKKEREKRLSFIEKVTQEGIFDYFARRIAFVFGIIVLALSLGYLVISQLVSEKNLPITILLASISLANFLIAVISFVKYKQLKASANIKYIQLGIKLCKLIVGIVGFALSMTIALGATHGNGFLTAVNIILVVFYALYITTQFIVLTFSFIFATKAQKRKKKRNELASRIANDSDKN